jgi:hypothetical protein
MTLIHVPRPPKSAYNPDRPISSLLKTQIEHLHEAGRKLPPKYHGEIYVSAIKTESEAARYIREVTEAIHAAHQEAERARRTPRRRRGLEIAAAADARAERKSQKPPRKARKQTKNSTKTRRKR